MRLRALKRRDRVSIRFKLLCVLLVIGAGAVVTTGLLGYEAGKRGLTQSAMNHLTGIRRSKAHQIEGYFREFAVRFAR